MADIESKSELSAPLVPRFIDFSVRLPPVMHNLNANALENFNPTQVIYRRLIPAPPFGCLYAFIDKPTPISADPAAIREFVSLAAQGHYQRTTPMVEEDHPLGILVKKDSYIVLHLDDAYPTWDFTHNYEAVTLGDLVDTPNPSLLYGNLKYVRPSGSIFDDAKEGCRLVYFEARYREGTDPQYIQKFNIGVDSGNPPTTYWVDPDVRHPGNASD
jgi:hypothetical protein